MNALADSSVDIISVIEGPASGAFGHFVHGVVSILQLCRFGADGVAQAAGTRHRPAEPVAAAVRRIERRPRDQAAGIDRIDSDLRVDQSISGGGNLGPVVTGPGEDIAGELSI